MKTIEKFFAFCAKQIKKNFFKDAGADFYSKRIYVAPRNADKQDQTGDEYLTSYKTTTRWQTL